MHRSDQKLEESDKTCGRGTKLSTLLRLLFKIDVAIKLELFLVGFILFGKITEICSYCIDISTNIRKCYSSTHIEH